MDEKKQWTSGRLRSFITTTIRGGFRRYPPKFNVLNEALVGKKLNEKTGREAKHYRCSHCKGEFPAKEVQVDHIEPVVIPEEGFVSWDKFIERLFCGEKDLQVLCIPCHKAKTKEEQRRKREHENSSS